MSQAAQKPHKVKIYGLKNVDGAETFGLLEEREFPSKCSANKWASSEKKKEHVTSAVLERIDG